MIVVSRTAHLVQMCNALHRKGTITGWLLCSVSLQNKRRKKEKPELSHPHHGRMHSAAPRHKQRQTENTAFQSNKSVLILQLFAHNVVSLMH